MSEQRGAESLAIECERLRALLKVAGEALEPFANPEAPWVFLNNPADEVEVHEVDDLTLGDFRRARAISNKIKAAGV